MPAATPNRTTRVVCFPFDQFGSGGTSEGARLLADAVREMVRDSRRESRPCRGHAFAHSIRLTEVAFDTMPEARIWRRRGRALARAAWHRGEFLVWLAGNHLAVLPVLEELNRAGTLIVQFDAHLDLYHLTDCHPDLSHGNFLRRLGAPAATLVNVGHRDLFLPRTEYAGTFAEVISAVELAIDPATAIARLQARAATAEQVFLDIDCDVFDPAFVPAVTHPLPFGPAPTLILRLIEELWSAKGIGLAVSEFDPGRDRDDRSLATLGWLLEYLLLRRHELRPLP